jgi:hypothetical protein
MPIEHAQRFDQEAVCSRFNDLVDFVNAMLSKREGFPDANTPEGYGAEK